MPFDRTVDILLRLIAQNQEADTALLASSETRQQEFARWLSVPLEASQHLILGWRRPCATPDLSKSAPLIDALQRVIALIQQETRVHELLAEAASLQWKLADSKIADRTAGLAASADVNPSDVLQHVHKVLASIEDGTAASQRIAQLYSELEDRERISAAKLVLQDKHTFTEEQAYMYLQQASRRSRRPIAQIAAEVCRADVHQSRRTA